MQVEPKHKRVIPNNEVDYLMKALFNHHVYDSKSKIIEQWQLFLKECCCIDAIPTMLFSEEELYAYYTAYKSGIIYDSKSCNSFARLLKGLGVKKNE